MHLLITVSLVDLIVFTSCYASDPPQFFLKGPTSQATIYGVDGSKITSFADAGSISSNGNVGPSVSSYSSSQNVQGPGTNTIFSPDCNCSQGAPSVVLQGPSMSATIIGPSNNNAGDGENQNENNVFNHQKHNGLNSVSPTSGQSVDTSALPSISSVNIQGPSARATNAGPSYTGHSDFVGNKRNQQFGATVTKPCESTSGNCGDSPSGVVHLSGTNINTYSSSALPSKTDFSYNHKSSLCDQFSKSCNDSASGLNSGTSINIQGSSTRSVIGSSHGTVNKVPISCNPFIKNCDGNASASASIKRTNIEGSSKSSSVNGPNYNSGINGISNTNYHISANHRTFPTTPDISNSYAHVKENNKQEQYGATFKSTYVTPLAEKSHVLSGSLQNGNNAYIHSSSLPSYIHGSNSNTARLSTQKSSSSFVQPYNQFSTNNGLSSSNVSDGKSTNIQSPSTSSPGTSSSHNVLFESSTNSRNVQHGATVPTGSENCNSSSKSCYNNVGNSNTIPSINRPSKFSDVKSASYNTETFRNPNENNGFPANGQASSPPPSSFNSYGYIAGSNRLKKPNIQGSIKAFSSTKSSNNFGSNDHFGNTEDKQGHFTSSSYDSSAYNKPSQTGSSKWFTAKSTSSYNYDAQLPENSMNFNKRNDGYSSSKYHTESSSIAPPTFIIPNNIPWLAKGVQQNGGVLSLNQKNPTNFRTNGEYTKHSKYDCYILQFPANTYAYVLPSVEYSELLKKIAQSTIADSNDNHKRSY